jgi:FixJ family two-component response regulator
MTAPRHTGRESGQADSPANKKRVVYIVDPDTEHSLEVSALLNRVGYSTKTYDSAEDLLNTPNDRFTHGCLISEMNLPGMNGLRLLRTLHQRGVWVPVIILTRDTDVSSAVQAFRNSVDGYLTKPYVERELVNKVCGLLQREMVSDR